MTPEEESAIRQACADAAEEWLGKEYAKKGTRLVPMSKILKLRQAVLKARPKKK
jgi:hypothetical protein